MGRRRNKYGEDILSGTPYQVGDVELAAQESTLETAQLPAIEPRFGGVVYTQEGEREVTAARTCWRVERHAIPVVLVGEGFRDGHVVETVIGIGIDAAIDHRR